MGQGTGYSAKGIVMAKLISTDEAKQVRDDSLQELDRLLKDARDGLNEITAPKTGRNDMQTPGELNKIRALLESLRKDIHGVSAEQVDIRELVERTKTIYALFEGVEGDARLKASVLLAETNAVLAHASARRMADTVALLEDPKRALSASTVAKWTFQGEYERIATEFQSRFPTFLGCRVEVRARYGEILVRLTCIPRKEGAAGVSPLEGLRQEMEKFLAWELRKIGYDMYYNIDVLYNPPALLLMCQIKIVPPGD